MGATLYYVLICDEITFARFVGKKIHFKINFYLDYLIYYFENKLTLARIL